MGLRDEHLARFEENEVRRVDRWRANWQGREFQFLQSALEMANLTPGASVRFTPPSAEQLTVDGDWHTSGIVITEGNLQLYLRRHTSNGEGELDHFDVHPVGLCRRCGELTPYRAATQRDQFAAEMYAGRPCAGHVCSA